MKHALVLGAGTLALVAGSAFAGEGGCWYGKQAAEIAAVDEGATPVVSEQESKLLALAAEQKLEREVELPVIHN